MTNFLIVGAGGFIGSCARFAFTKLANLLPFSFPLGTLFSNITAAFLVGFIIGVGHETLVISPKTKLFLTTGIMGGLSTFSTFSLETVTLFQDGRYLGTAGNILLNLVLSLSFTVFGMLLARSLFSKA